MGRIRDGALNIALFSLWLEAKVLAEQHGIEEEVGWSTSSSQEE